MEESLDLVEEGELEYPKLLAEFTSRSRKSLFLPKAILSNNTSLSINIARNAQANASQVGPSREILELFGVPGM